MIKGLVLHSLVKAAILALIVLVLYGVIPDLAILIPLNFARHTSWIFSLRDSHHWGWEGAVVAALRQHWPARSVLR